MRLRTRDETGDAVPLWAANGDAHADPQAALRALRKRALVTPRRVLHHQFNAHSFLTVSDDAVSPSPDDADVLALSVSLQLAEGLDPASARFLALWNIGQERMNRAKWSAEDWKWAIKSMRRTQ